MTKQFQEDIFVIIEADANKFDIFIERCESSFCFPRFIYQDLNIINAKKRDKDWEMVLMKKLVKNLLNEIQTQPRFNQKMGKIIEQL